MVPILANLPILGRFLRVGCSRSFREKTTFVAQNKKNMVNVIVLCIELLLDIVGLVLGILVYSRSSLRPHAPGIPAAGTAAAMD